MSSKVSFSWTSTIVVLVVVLSTVVNAAKVKYDIDDVHDFHNNQEFLTYVDEQYSMAKGKLKSVVIGTELTQIMSEIRKSSSVARVLQLDSIGS